MKIKKLSIRITLFVVIATTIGILVQSIFAANHMRNIMRSEAEKELDGKLISVSAQLDGYIEKEFAYIDGYMASVEMDALVETPDDESVLKAAQNFTEHYCSIVPNAKSLFYTEYNGTVLTHTLPNMVGYQNSPERIKMIQGIYYNSTGIPVYSSVAAVSPATGDVSLVVARSSYNSGKSPAGYASIELDKSEFYKIFNDNLSVANNQEVVLTGINNPVVYYSNNPAEITLTSENPAIIDLSSKISSGSVGEFGTVEYIQAGTGHKMLGCYRYIAGNDWLLFIGADESELYSQASQASIRTLGNGLLVVVAIAIVLALIIGYLIKPISVVETTLTQVSQYNLNVGDEIVPFEKRSDEIGRLSLATSNVIKVLTESVELFQNCSSALSESSVDLNDATQKLTEVTSENKDVAGNLSVMINQTNDSIGHIREEMDNIVGQVNLVSEKVKLGNEDSEVLIENAEKINKQIDEEIRKNVSTLQDTMDNMQEALESLKAVEQINELAEAIMSITSQTNLLSLNASIEAARAGEAGRGFAVVAQEIGQLAEQSQKTAMNITEIVTASNQSVANVRNQVTSLIDFIKNDVLTSFEVFSSQSKIYDEGISKIEKSVEAIGEAMESLNSSVDEISRNISSVSDASEENLSGVENIMDKNVQTSEVTIDIGRLAKDSKENAVTLKEVIEKFTV